jgi:cytochrome c2
MRTQSETRIMKLRGIASTRLVIGLGCLMVVAVVGDMVVRGFQREVAAPVWEPPRHLRDPGRRAIVNHGCGGCHVIPGIRHATGRVGPKLNDFREQMYIAGVLPNVPENLVAWILDPAHFSPRTAMPNLDITEEEARAITAYLYANP